MIAQSKNSARRSNFIDESDRARLFVVCPREYTEEDLKEKFIQFGCVDYCQIVRDHTTKKSKGLGYVKFHKASAAAVALENCDANFRAILAQPKTAKVTHFSNANNESTNNTNMSNFSVANYLPSLLCNTHLENEVKLMEASIIAQKAIQNLMHENVKANENQGTTKNGLRLFVIVSTQVSQEQLHRLFDIIPGMLSCKIKLNHQTGESKGFAYVTYSSLAMAAYAREKLNGIEYPIGHKLIIKYAEDPPTSFKKSKSVTESADDDTLHGSQCVYDSSSTANLNSKENQFYAKRNDPNHDEIMTEQLTNGTGTSRKRLKISPDT